jgi:hypothetical protein
VRLFGFWLYRAASSDANKGPSHIFSSCKGHLVGENVVPLTEKQVAYLRRMENGISIRKG